jgi:CRISPR/Cas system Type II protein with McrA/HNH and RuvC-like nuclease domain
MGYSTETLNYVYDKNGGYCAYCNKKLAFTNYGKMHERSAWEVDHSVPKSRGGTGYLRNLVPACIDCNRRKGTRMGKSVRSTQNYYGESASVNWGGVVLALGVTYLLYRLSLPRRQ